MTDFNALSPIANFVTTEIDRSCEQFKKINVSEQSFFSFASKISANQGSAKASFGVNTFVAPLKQSLSKFEEIAQGATTGKFSMLEAASALKEAKLCLELMSEVRKQLVSGLNQILNSSSG